MREIENKYNCVVYAITHEFTDFGECWDFLLVTNYPTEWDGLVYDLGANKYGAFAYVWNKDDNWCSAKPQLRIAQRRGGVALPSLPPRGL